MLHFSSDWQTRFYDPYAVLGLPVTADDQRVKKRHRLLARLIHPDSHAHSDRETRESATQIFARLVSPAYQKIQQEVGRSENLALLRVKARQLFKETPQLKGEQAMELLKLPASALDIFYEQAVSQLAERQYEPLEQFAIATEQLAELNLVYLWRRNSESIRPKPGPAVIPSPAVPRPAEPEPPQKRDEFYAEKHYQRAQEYVANAAWSSATRELKDAIELVPNRSQYHALLGKVYVKQNLPGTARAYVKRALELNPGDRLAQEYAARLRLQVDIPAPVEVSKSPKATGAGCLLRLFARSKS